MALHEVIYHFKEFSRWWAPTTCAKARKLLRVIEEYYVDSDERERDRLIPKIAEMMEDIPERDLEDIWDALSSPNDPHARRLRKVANAVLADRSPPPRNTAGWRKGKHMPDPNYPRRVHSPFVLVCWRYQGWERKFKTRATAIKAAKHLSKTKKFAEGDRSHPHGWSIEVVEMQRGKIKDRIGQALRGVFYPAHGGRGFRLQRSRR